MQARQRVERHVDRLRRLARLGIRRYAERAGLRRSAEGCVGAIGEPALDAQFGIQHRREAATEDRIDHRLCRTRSIRARGTDVAEPEIRLRRAGLVDQEHRPAGHPGGRRHGRQGRACLAPRAERSLELPQQRRRVEVADHGDDHPVTAHLLCVIAPDVVERDRCQGSLAATHRTPIRMAAEQPRIAIAAHQRARIRILRCHDRLHGQHARLFELSEHRAWDAAARRQPARASGPRRGT